ncbi:uncharacterized protein LOC128555045 [Mercenaria mercenaria]|uniref:uncharacterized protein LOC128555045 n=1 Tax=Mercenaria mercenaria TaxID=6596 RepID=UPI00234EC706|nr:uncharacterized protein LOC128555045 [Mercenaria mercenaria]
MPSQETENQDEQSDADINGGQLIIKMLEVYQVVEDRLQDPWRYKPTDIEVAKMKKKLENIETLPGLGLEVYNILLIGIIGAGKSSFFNTLATVFAKDVKSHAIVGEEAESITNEVHAYKLATDTGKQLKLRIFDIRGFEDKRGYDNELDLLLEGKLPVGFNFPEQPTSLSPEELNQNRGLKDEIHLVCFVVDATNLDVVSDEIQKRISDIKKAIRTKAMPMVSVATKFDNLCPKISENADHVYNSPKAKDSTKAVSACFGIPLKHVFPIVNYMDETVHSSGKDRLAVQALNSMVQLMVDYLQLHKGMAKKCDSWTRRPNHLTVSKSDHERSLQILGMADLLSDFNDRNLNVLCVGYVHSGKSSFIDAVSSLLTGKISKRVSKGFTCEDDAHVSPESTTETFEMYKIKYKNDAGEMLTTKVRFGDMPGFQKEGGMTFDHAKNVVNGKVPNKFKIKQGITKESKKYIKKPTKENKIHCICYVFDVCSVDSLQESFVTEFKYFQTWLRIKGIPYIVILTKADRLSDAVKENCLQVFDNMAVKEIKDKLIKKFNFVESKMFPVINYVHQDRVVPEMDALLSEVFKEILDTGREYLDDLEESSGGEDVSDEESDDESE